MAELVCSFSPLTLVAVVTDGTWWEPDEGLFGSVEYGGKIPTVGLMREGQIFSAA